MGLVVWCLFMLAIYRLVPNRTYRVRELWPGVLIAGAAMELLTLLWPFYTHFSKGSSTYGAVFALVFLLASWLYFLAEFILLGAVANRCTPASRTPGGSSASGSRVECRSRRGLGPVARFPGRERDV